MTGRSRPAVLCDFDGVIHRYSRGWADGTAYDEPMPGARQALQDITDAGYEVWIFSTRDRKQIIDWLTAHDFPPYPVTNEKRVAVAIIDDRAIRFQDWAQAAGELTDRYPVIPRG